MVRQHHGPDGELADVVDADDTISDDDTGVARGWAASILADHQVAVAGWTADADPLGWDVPGWIAQPAGTDQEAEDDQDDDHADGDNQADARGGLPFDADTAGAWLAATVGDSQGQLAVAFGHDGAWTGPGRWAYPPGRWVQRSYPWPAHQGRFLADVGAELAAGARVDVYVCPYLRATDRRAKGNAIARPLIHADHDGTHPIPAQRLRALGGFAVASGTPGHEHVYVPLSLPLDTGEHEALCRALARHLGDCDPKVSDNDVLRLPGTWNFKHTPPAPVTFTHAPTPARPHPDHLARLLADALTPTSGSGARPEAARSLPASPTGPEASHRTAGPVTTAAGTIDCDRLPRGVQLALAEVSGDRSADTMRIVAACHDAGLTLAATRGAIGLRGDLAGRLGERGDDDVLTCWLKVTDSRQPRTTPPPALETPKAARSVPDPALTPPDWARLPPGGAAPAATEQAPTPVPAPRVDPAVFHGILGDIVAAADPTTEADPVGVLGSLLTMVSGLIGPGPHLRIGNTRHPLLIWTLLLGSTGRGRKGEAEATAGLFVGRSDDAFAAIRVGGLSTGEGLIERIRDPDDDAETSTGTKDKRLVVIETEFGTVLARARREGNTLPTVLRQAWDGARLGVLNRQALVASSSHVAVSGQITPKEFRAKLSASDLAGGLYNRFLPLYVTRSKELPVPEGINEGVLGDLALALRQAITRARDVERIRLDRDATTVWADGGMYAELTGGPDDGPVAEFTQRAAPYTLRLASLYAALTGHAWITPPDLTAAHALIRYAAESAAYILVHTPTDAECERDQLRLQVLRDAVTAAGPAGLNGRAVSALFSRKVPAAALEALVARLVTGGGFVTETRPTGGRPTQVLRAARPGEERQP